MRHEQLLMFAVGLGAALLALPLALSDIPRACTGEHSHYAFCNTSLSLHDRVEDLLQRIPLPDKALLLTARASPRGDVPAIGLPEYNWGANCVHGVQSTCGTNCPTSFPNPINLGAIFDPDAIFQMAQVIGWELRALWLEGARENYPSGPHLGLDCWSPNININRDPRWGRNMETPSEDPLVNARYGVAYTRGLQEGPDKRYLQAVVTLKHWIAYSFESYGGVDRMAFDAKVSKYDFADTYFPAFRASVVDGKAKGIMCSYNSLNGVPTCSNPYLTHILREELAFDGYITSDSGAIEAIYERHHYSKDWCDAGAISLTSGTDVCSGQVYRKCLEQLVTSRKIDIKVVDDALRRTLAIRFKLGLFDPTEDQPYWHVAPSEVNKPQHRQLSLDLTRKSLVLLQNHRNVLPLKNGTRIALIGPHIDARGGMMGNYYGQICHGDYHDLSCVQTPLQAIEQANGRAPIVWARGCEINDKSTAGFKQARKAALRSDVAVLFLGIDTTIEYEPHDRVSIALPNTQLQLLKLIRRTGKPVIVILFNGGVIGAEEIIVNADAVVEAFYPGYYGAQAIADVLFGDTNPSGKLPVTMYRSNYVHTVDMASMDMTKYPGRSYRYFKELPVFPFGWGLSYTNFTLRSSSPPTNTSHPLLVTPALGTQVAVNLTNTGARDGEEVLLCFFRPLRVNITGPATHLNQQLIDYRRVRLAEQESKLTVFAITADMLSLVDPQGTRSVWPGYYEILVTNGVHERVSFVVHVVVSSQAASGTWAWRKEIFDAAITSNAMATSIA